MHVASSVRIISGVNAFELVRAVESVRIDSAFTQSRFDRLTVMPYVDIRSRGVVARIEGARLVNCGNDLLGSRLNPIWTSPLPGVVNHTIHVRRLTLDYTAQLEPVSGVADTVSFNSFVNSSLRLRVEVLMYTDGAFNDVKNALERAWTSNSRLLGDLSVASGFAERSINFSGKAVLTDVSFDKSNFAGGSAELVYEFVSVAVAGNSVFDSIVQNRELPVDFEYRYVVGAGNERLACKAFCESFSFGAALNELPDFSIALTSTGPVTIAPVVV